jgi:hypothetical protein
MSHGEIAFSGIPDEVRARIEVGGSSYLRGAQTDGSVGSRLMLLMNMLAQSPWIRGFEDRVLAFSSPSRRRNENVAH